MAGDVAHETVSHDHSAADAAPTWKHRTITHQ